MKKKLFLLATVLSLITVTPVSAECQQHEWSDWIVEEEPDCFEKGYQFRWCYNCDAEEQQTIPAYGSHDWNAWEVNEEPTCEDSGENVRECLRCGATESLTVPATGKHIWSKWWTEEEPDCMNTGLSMRECSQCYKTETKKIAKNPKKHSYSSWMTVKKATAFSTGTAERECYICQAVQKKSLAKLKTVSASTKEQKAVKKVISNFFTYAKKYDTKKIKTCFASPKKVKLFETKKKMASFYRSSNKGSLKYAFKSFSVSKKTATVKVYCRYQDTYWPAFYSVADADSYLILHPKTSNTKIDKYQYEQIVKWNKKYTKQYSDTTLSIKLKKVGKSWKISSYTKALNNAIHGNYQDAYDYYYSL